jgi:hypothetical protein
MSETNANEIDKLFLLARSGLLPKGFDRWGLADKYGQTVAHVAAEYGHLPEGFDRWELADNDGWTVPQVAAEHSDLSKASDPWGLGDPYRGLNVCYNCPSVNSLPEGFDQWERADNDGKTVAHVAALKRAHDERSGG